MTSAELARDRDEWHRIADQRLEEIERIRAALRERDAAWLKAVSKHFTGTSSAPPGIVMCAACDSKTPCASCAPLRALLEEAGK